MAQCPFAYMNRSAGKPTQLNLKVLHPTNHLPYDYAAEFKTLDLAAVKKDLATTLTTSQVRQPTRTKEPGMVDSSLPPRYVVACLVKPCDVASHIFE